VYRVKACEHAPNMARSGAAADQECYDGPAYPEVKHVHKLSAGIPRAR